MLSTYLRAVGACKSWDSGNILAQVLPSIERLTDNQIDELVTAFNENVELRGSFGVCGTKTNEYGTGLVPDLNRLGTRQFRRASGYIEQVT
jgi:hypothetical protein